MAREPQMKVFPVVGWSYYQPMAHPLKAGKLCPDISFYDDYLDDRNGVPHGACDITANLGSYVVSPISGTAWSNVQEGDEPDDLVYFERGGWHVYVVGDDGFIYYFAHLIEKSPVSPGDRVEAGEFLGRVGRSGVVYGCPHLHFAVYRIVESGKGGSINPYPHLRRLYQDNAAAHYSMRANEVSFPRNKSAMKTVSLP